jgi:hypothetical protein
VIDIDEKDYVYIAKKHCLPSCDDRTLRKNVYEMIKNGTPLPKEQEPCEDAISRRDMALNIVSFYNKATGKKKTLDFLCKCVERLPSMQPKQRTGHWIDNKARTNLCNCSECGALSKAYSKYCPNCGAKMEVTE